MKIRWYGHAAFLVEGANGQGLKRRVILDPYNYPGCGGYLPIDEGADVVCVSHDNPRYHSDTSAIQGDFQLAQALEFAGEEREVGGITFGSHPVFENSEGEGPNAMVRFTLDGISVGHLGDLGHALDHNALEFLSGVDVLLALTGGPPTLTLPDLMDAVDALQPPIVVPMHFKTPKVNLNLQPLEDFLAIWTGLVQRPGGSEFTVEQGGLPAEITLLVLEHAR